MIGRVMVEWLKLDIIGSTLFPFKVFGPCGIYHGVLLLCHRVPELRDAGLTRLNTRSTNHSNDKRELNVD